jgi:hypothetical protein
MGEKQTRKLLQRAKDAPGGWSAAEVIDLYKAFGFEIVAGAKHDLAKHPGLPNGVKATITRSSGKIHPDYVRTAVNLIEMITKKEESQNG